MQKSNRFQAPTASKKPQISANQQHSTRSKKPDPSAFTEKEPQNPDISSKYDTNFSQESQSLEFLEKRVENIVKEAVCVSQEGDNEEENLRFSEKVQQITTNLQTLLENFFGKLEGLDNWLKETLGNYFQSCLERLSETNQTLETHVRERNELMEQTTQALGLAVSVQKYLKENQKLWT